MSFSFFLFLQRDFGDKRVFSERRRNDSFAEEEPEWFSGGPTSQSETIELIGFDDKILEDDKRRPRRSRKRPESVKEGMSTSGNASHCGMFHGFSLDFSETILDGHFNLISKINSHLFSSGHFLLQCCDSVGPS